MDMKIQIKNKSEVVIFECSAPSIKLALVEAVRGNVSLRRANLNGTDLSEVDLQGIDLSEADLSNADLSHSNLWRASLAGAILCQTTLIATNLSRATLNDARLCRVNLTDADLAGASMLEAVLEAASLHRATLREANLSGADFTNANIASANLSKANLFAATFYGANMKDVNLVGANLSGANLHSATLEGAFGNEYTSFWKIQCPEEGEFVGWKMCCDGVIVKLLIPAKAKRSSATSRKCRAEYVKTLKVIGAKVGVSEYDNQTLYRPGKITKCGKWNSDRWKECGGGIHFFMTRSEAESYSL